jgi:hypothetical protein
VSHFKLHHYRDSLDKRLRRPVDIGETNAADLFLSEAGSFGGCHSRQAFGYTLIGNVNVRRERAQIVGSPVRRRTTAAPFHILPVQIATLAAAGGPDIIWLTLEPTEQRVSTAPRSSRVNQV